MTAAHSNATSFPRTFTVLDAQEEARNVVTLRLLHSDEGNSVDFANGQFCMLYIFGCGEIPISIAGRGGSRGELVFTIRNVGPISAHLTKLVPGSTVGLRGPFGRGWPESDTRDLDLLVIAGGIGLAPLRSTLEDRAKSGLSSRTTLLYGAKKPDELLYGDQIEEWRRNIRVEVTVDIAAREWTGPVGLVTSLLERVDIRPEATAAYLCGPEIMMRICAEALGRRGLAPSRIFVSLERNMKCAVAHCGRCQFGPVFACKDGPVFPYSYVSRLLKIREV
jgi:NAD(P)H-flavin reductase